MVDMRLDIIIEGLLSTNYRTSTEWPRCASHQPSTSSVEEAKLVLGFGRVEPVESIGHLSTGTVSTVGYSRLFTCTVLPGMRGTGRLQRLSSRSEMALIPILV
jgi:hypothetical protein